MLHFFAEYSLSERVHGGLDEQGRNSIEAFIRVGGHKLSMEVYDIGRKVKLLRHRRDHCKLGQNNTLFAKPGLKNSNNETRYFRFQKIQHLLRVKKFTTTSNATFLFS